MRAWKDALGPGRSRTGTLLINRASERARERGNAEEDRAHIEGHVGVNDERNGFRARWL
jgi:hypothetical protein